MPMKRVLSCNTSDNFVIGKVDVLDARMAFFFRYGSIFLYKLCLSSKSSNTASITRSLPEIFSSDESVFTFPRSFVFSSSDNFFRLTLSFKSVSIFAFPASAASIF